MNKNILKAFILITLIILSCSQQEIVESTGDFTVAEKVQKEIQIQQIGQEKVQKEIQVKQIGQDATIIIGSAAATTVGVTGGLTAAGFTSSGVAGGSVAAGVQSSIGVVASGSAFSIAQSLGASGTLAAIGVGAIAVVIIAVAAYAAFEYFS